MVQYTLVQSPEVLLNIPGKDSPKAREKAMDQLIELMDDGKLPTDLSEGFGPQQFIEVKEPAPVASGEEDNIAQAVQVLSNLATLKLKVQESRTEALQIRDQIDILFSDAIVSEDEITNLKEGFKVLKSFAQNNLRYREARAQAEDARSILDRALNSAEAAVPKASKKTEAGEPTPDSAEAAVPKAGKKTEAGEPTPNSAEAAVPKSGKKSEDAKKSEDPK